MPIYGYQCSSCGHQKDVLQKISDPVLTTCPECGQEAYSKQVSAPNFQLKGSGWYVTDFRDGNKGGKDAKPKDDGSSKESGSDGGGAKQDAKSDSGSGGGAAATESSGSGSSTESSSTSSDSSKPASTSTSGSAGSGKSASPPPSGSST